ncbi:glycosyltransferase [Actinomyces sp. 2119]|uniref:glycosyltransferase family 2 protein n=1 Tax=Actinomyces sp. 2119 TaxID=2321393 RepID=UPI000E6BD516|nr:glycosyltransferase [Actinomyces sp. 2119]RJF40999.1 glycosyltransferase [Actinomyces sp. 2119]
MVEPVLTIAMLTYRRNSYLRAVLPLLVDQAASVAHWARPRVLVVDNDPQAGARPVVVAALDGCGFTDFGTGAVSGSAAAATGRVDVGGLRIGLTYVHEPEPGIVAGRNRALDEARDDDLLVFIDDDETPEPGWLAALVAQWRTTRCAAVTGPTPADFAEPPPPWVEASGAFDSWQAEDGAQVGSADTGNLLLDLAVVRRLGLRFDPRYGLTGGEDSLFTRQLTRAGGVIRFATGAVVSKKVPRQRATRAWVLRRAFRSGSSWVRVRVDTAGRVRLPLRVAYAAKGAAKAGADFVRGAGARLRGDLSAQARYEVSSRGGLGMVVGACDVRVREYGRPGHRLARHVGGSRTGGRR